MTNQSNRYQEMERYMFLAILADLILFIIYLICAGFGIIWLKVILTVLILLLSGAIVAILYLSKELLRRRSLWMSTAAAAIALCLLFSLILNFPCPKPQKQILDNSGISQTE